MTESPLAAEQDQPRGKRRPGAAVALGCCSILWLLQLVDAGDAFGIVWFGTALLTCLGGLAVATGRSLVCRGDTWQAALVAAPASLLGPLSAALLLSPAVRLALGEVEPQIRARNELDELGPDQPPATRSQVTAPDSQRSSPAARHTPEQAAAAHGKGAALALGLVASTLAFWGSIFLLVWVSFAADTITDGTWFVLSLVVAFVVGAVAFVGVLIAQSRRRILAGIEQGAAAGMLVAIAFVAVEGGALHSTDGSRVGIGFVFALWALVAVLFLGGAAMARRMADE